jgi:hypothetical protein
MDSPAFKAFWIEIENAKIFNEKTKYTKRNWHEMSNFTIYDFLFSMGSNQP